MPDSAVPRSHGPYHAYLVRLWQESPDLPWRAFARDAETDEERRFATVEQLFLFLHRQTEGGGARMSGEAQGPGREDE